MSQQGRIFISARSARSKDAARLLLTVLGRPLVILHDEGDETLFSEKDVVVALDGGSDSSGVFHPARVFKLEDATSSAAEVRCRLANGESYALRTRMRRRHEQTGFELEPTRSNRAAAMLAISLRRARKTPGDDRLVDRLDVRAGLLFLERLVSEEAAVSLRTAISDDLSEDHDPIAMLESELARSDPAGYRASIPSLRRFIEETDASGYPACRPVLLAHPALLVYAAISCSARNQESRGIWQEVLADYEKHARTAKRRCGLLGAAMVMGEEKLVRSILDDLGTPTWSVRESALMALTPASRNIERSLLSAIVVAVVALRTEDAGIDSLLPGFDQHELSWQGFGSQSMARSIEGTDQQFIDLKSNSIARCVLENWLMLMEQPPECAAAFVIDEDDYGPDVVAIESIWGRIIDHLSIMATGLAIRSKVWPVGHEFAVSFRYDVDRPLPEGRLETIRSMQEELFGRPCSSWYLLEGDEATFSVGRDLAGTDQEIGLHARKPTSEKGVGSGVTMHSAPDSEYWRGVRSVDLFDAKSFLYAEQMVFSAESPRPAWLGTRASRIWCFPLHFPIEGSTSDEDLSYFSRLIRECRRLRDLGGHVILGAHPDCKPGLVRDAVHAVGLESGWAAPLAEVLERARSIRGVGALQVSIHEDGVSVKASENIRGVEFDLTCPALGLDAARVVLDLRRGEWTPLIESKQPRS